MRGVDVMIHMATALQRAEEREPHTMITAIL